MTERKKRAVSFLPVYAVFLGMFLVFGPGVYNDSDQYIKMHIHREPLYPLFLALLRTLFPGEENWLTAMGILQNLIAAFSVWAYAEYVGRRFKLSFLGKTAVLLLGFAPHVITMFFSSLHLFMSNSVMSEALCLPFFTLFMMECFKIVVETDRKAVRKAVWTSLVLALLLSLTRSQMMLTVLMWLMVAGARVLCANGTVLEAGEKIAQGDHRKPAGVGSGIGIRIGKGKAWRLSMAVIAVVCVFCLRTLAVKSYNLVFNGHFINNTYGTVNTLTNILYAADREDGERIKDAEARDFFYRMYDLTEERQANYKYAGDSWKEKAEHIEEWHDTVKYEMIEDVFYQTYDKEVTSDYIIQNLMADETAGKIIKGILPACFARWFGNYLLIARYGLVRSIAVVHPVLNWAAAFLYLSAFLMMWLVYRKDRKNPAVPLMLVALLAVAANVSAVSLTIMCLSRYMIYGFVPFYTGYFLLALSCYREYRKG